MSTDARLNRFFPGIVVLLIALGAYLQALGLTHLFAANLDVVPFAALRPFRDQVRPTALATEEKSDGSAILARNPFDSVTGPLNARDVRIDPREITGKNQADPFADPICESMRVLLITTANDPSWSFAAIAMGNDKASLRRIGDGVGDRIVYAIMWDRVWMMKDGLRCQAPLGRSVIGVATGLDKSKVSENADPKSRSRLPPEIAARITRISDTRFDVDRSVIDMVVEKQRELLGSLRVVPTHDADGAGLKLMGIRPGSLLNSLGLVNGDQLRMINGFDMGDPMIAMQAYTRLLTADKLDVRIVRGGQSVTLDIRLR